MKHEDVTEEDYKRFTLEETVTYCARKVGIPESWVENLGPKEIITIMTQRLHKSLEAERLAEEILEGTGLALPSTKDLEKAVQELKGQKRSGGDFDFGRN